MAKKKIQGKKVKKNIHVDVGKHKRELWVRSENKRKNERVLEKKKNDKGETLVKVKRWIDPYSYEYQRMCYEYSIEQIRAEFRKKADLGYQGLSGMMRDLEILHRNTQFPPFTSNVSAKSFFDFDKQDYYGVDTPDITEAEARKLLEEDKQERATKKKKKQTSKKKSGSKTQESAATARNLIANKQDLLEEAYHYEKVLKQLLDERNKAVDDALANIKITKKEVIDACVKEGKRLDEFYTKMEYGKGAADADRRRRKDYAMERLPEIIDSIKKTGKYPILPDDYKFRSFAHAKAEYSFRKSLDPQFREKYLLDDKMEEVPFYNVGWYGTDYDKSVHNRFSLTGSMRRFHNNYDHDGEYERAEFYEKLKLHENKNAKFLNDRIETELAQFETQFEGKKESVFEVAKQAVKDFTTEYTKTHKEYIEYIKGLESEQEIQDAIEVANRKYEKIGKTKEEIEKEMPKHTVSEIYNMHQTIISAIEHRDTIRTDKEMLKDSFNTLPPDVRKEDMKETSNITMENKTDAIKKWSLAPDRMDIEGFDTSDKKPQGRFTIAEFKKELARLGADPDKVHIEKYGTKETIYYDHQIVRAIYSGEDRAEALRKALAFGIQTERIPINPSEYKPEESTFEVVKHRNGKFSLYEYRPNGLRACIKDRESKEAINQYSTLHNIPASKVTVTAEKQSESSKRMDLLNQIGDEHQRALDYYQKVNEDPDSTDEQKNKAFHKMNNAGILYENFLTNKIPTTKAQAKYNELVMPNWTTHIVQEKDTEGDFKVTKVTVKDDLTDEQRKDAINYIDSEIKKYERALKQSKKSETKHKHQESIKQLKETKEQLELEPIMNNPSGNDEIEQAKKIIKDFEQKEAEYNFAFENAKTWDAKNKISKQYAIEAQLVEDLKQTLKEHNPKQDMSVSELDTKIVDIRGLINFEASKPNGSGREKVLELEKTLKQLEKQRERKKLDEEWKKYDNQGKELEKKQSKKKSPSKLDQQIDELTKEHDSYDEINAHMRANLQKTINKLQIQKRYESKLLKAKNKINIADPLKKLQAIDKEIANQETIRNKLDKRRSELNAQATRLFNMRTNHTLTQRDRDYADKEYKKVRKKLQQYGDRYLEVLNDTHTIQQELEKEKNQVQNTLKKQKAKEEAAREKEEAAREKKRKELAQQHKATLEYERKKRIKAKRKAQGKKLFSSSFDPAKTHLALTSSMNDMQKRQLIKLAKENDIDPMEIDASLKFDENKNHLESLIFGDKSYDNPQSETYQKLADLTSEYHGIFTPERLRERKIDDQSTEKKVIYEDDIAHGRKKEELEKWREEPYKSKIDVQGIDTKQEKPKRKKTIVDRILEEADN